MRLAQKQGTPDYNTTDAPVGQTANANIPRELVFWLILLAVMAVLCAFVWLVMVPASDAAVAEARRNLMMAGAVNA